MNGTIYKWRLMNGNFGINVSWLFVALMSAVLVQLSSWRTVWVLVISKERCRGFLVIATFGVQSAKCIEGFTSNAGHDAISILRVPWRSIAECDHELPVKLNFAIFLCIEPRRKERGSRDSVTAQPSPVTN